jgi:hypothetical protein
MKIPKGRDLTMKRFGKWLICRWAGIGVNEQGKDESFWVCRNDDGKLRLFSHSEIEQVLPKKEQQDGWGYQ